MKCNAEYGNTKFALISASDDDNKYQKCMKIVKDSNDNEILRCSTYESEYNLQSDEKLFNIDTVPKCKTCEEKYINSLDD